MEELLELALEAGRTARIQAVEVRIVPNSVSERLGVRNGLASALTWNEGGGVGVRARTDRSWGFASASVLDTKTVRATAQRAARLARAARASALGPLELTEDPVVVRGEYRTEFRIDPFAVPVEEKLALLKDAEAALHVDPQMKVGEASYIAWRETKHFASSEGRSYTSTILHVGAGIQATAIGGGEVQRRSAPTSFGGDFRQSGYEFVRDLDLVGRAPAVGKEAVELLTAPAPPTGPTTLLIGSDQLALQVHESVGHATELDRIFAMEAGYAGTSWVDPGQIGKLRYGSPLMEIVADATEPGGLGTFGFDDEGVPARRVPIVEHGRLVGTLSSRETARKLGLEYSGATSRAEGFYRMPLIRMTNVDLLPGDHSLEELLEGVGEGVFMETNRSWSIDDRRLNFQFGTEIGRRIVHGEMGALYRNPIYSGMTPEFWGSMDAVGNADTWHLWGIPNCGKGQPGQVAHVSHGAPIARFRQVAVRGG